MIDITCSACDIVYHADETHIGRGFRCKVCGKILLVERQVLAPSELRQVERPVTDSKARERSRDRWIGIGIIVGAAICLAVWFWWPNSQRENPPASTTASQAVPATQSRDLEPIAPLDIKIPPPLKRLDLPKISKAKPLPFGPIRLRREEDTSSSSSLAIPPASSPPPSLVVTPTCAQGQNPDRLATGARIEPDKGNSGASTLKIMNGLDDDAAVRLMDTSTDQTSRFVYIRAKDEYTIQGIEPGNYSLLYATGSDWITKCGEFQRDEEIDEFEGSHEFQERVFDEGGCEHHRWTEAEITLNPVPLGNARTKRIDRKRFFQGDQHFSLAP